MTSSFVSSPPPAPARGVSDNRWRYVVEAFTMMTAAADRLSLGTTIESVVLEILRAGACAFLVIDRRTRKVVFEAPGRVYFHDRPLDEIDGLSAWEETFREPVLLPDISRMSWPAPLRPSDLYTTRSALIVPSVADDPLQAVLVVFSRSADHPFQSEDLEICTALCRHAGYAVGHMIQYENAHQEVLGRSALYEVGKRISSSLDLEEVLTLIIESLRMVIPYNAAVILLLDKGKGVVSQQTIRGYGNIGTETMLLKVGEGISGWAAKMGKAIIVPDVRKDPRYADLRPETRSEMAVPLIQGDEVIGVFNIESDLLDAYDERDQALLEAFASQATIAIQNARLYQESRRGRQLEHELGVAGEIQRALMPRNIPHPDGVVLSVLSEPSAEVGGDFYDILTIGDKYIGMAVGDVVGKGVPAAIMMASLYTVFHEYATDPLMMPSDVMTRVNAKLNETTAPDRFATLFYGVLNLRDGAVHYCNAGHNPPLLCRADGSVSYLDTGGLVLGAFPNAEYALGETELAEGDILVLYTDGVTEA
ncbi:MAG: SpoIIE family protein phosphatase, partial [candidate division Zixibacteria bacterium]|nr:SpoIIE family protein phosphatase [candidate division Zixibacteria bacterium]